MASIQIQEQEFQARMDQLRVHLKAEGLSGVVLLDNAYVLYYTGFAFIPTERPIAFLLNVGGEKGLFVPRLEYEHAQANALVDTVRFYPEYPDNPHPMQGLLKFMLELGIQGRFGADNDGYPWILGYRGPSLSELCGERPYPVSGVVEDQLAIKSIHGSPSSRM